MYFDIDIFEGQREFNLSEIINILNNFITYAFTHPSGEKPIFNVAMTEKKDSKKISSYHIIIDNYYVDYYSRNLLRALLCRHDKQCNCKVPQIDSPFDPYVYHEVQAFRMPYRSKGDGRFLIPLGKVAIDEYGDIYTVDNDFSVSDFLLTVKSCDSNKKIVKPNVEYSSGFCAKSFKFSNKHQNIKLIADFL